jgi:anaerobic magnesium-protoporphyrin IX monomethyl ester cyclase
MNAVNPKKKILLVFPGQPATDMQKRILVNLPLSVLQLAANIQEHGYESVIYDMRVQSFNEVEPVLDSICAVGISSMTGIQIKFGLQCASQIKSSFPDLPLIWGGIHPTLFPEQCLQHHLVDYVVKGEGEESLLKLLNFITSKNTTAAEIPGIGFKNDGRIIINPDAEFMEMETLPLAAYRLVDLNRYPNILHSFDYQSSRGCPFRCGFCYNLAFNRRRWRSKSAQKVFDELEYLVKTFGVKKFSFNDDEFFINTKRVLQICDLIIENKLNIEWHASCRLDIICKFSNEELQKIRLSGCHSMNFGAESGSENMLQYINKDILPKDILKGAEHAASNGILTLLSFMGGFPGETYADLMQTKNLISQAHKANKNIISNGVFVFNPYPGTFLYEESLKLGVELPADLEGWGDWNFKYEADHPWITPKHRQALKVIFYIVRLNYYLKEIMIRPGYSKLFRYLVWLVFLPLSLIAKLRWKYNLFSAPIELNLWAYIMKKAFGFL